MERKRSIRGGGGSGRVQGGRKLNTLWADSLKTDTQTRRLSAADRTRAQLARWPDNVVGKLWLGVQFRRRGFANANGQTRIADSSHNRADSLTAFRLRCPG